MIIKNISIIFYLPLFLQLNYHTESNPNTLDKLPIYLIIGLFALIITIGVGIYISLNKKDN